MRKFLLFIALIISGVGFVNAQDVGDNTIIDYEGYSLQFTVTNAEPAECEVICSTNPATETAITIPSSVEIKEVECSVTSIGDYAFYDCSRLTSIEIPNSVTSIGDWAFVYSGLTRIEIPNSVTSIGDWAFFSCFGLTTIEIPNSVTSIGDNAFYQCFGLTSIEIPNSVTTIGDWAFYGCSELTSLEILNGVTSIGDNAFSFCSNLTEIEIPNSVTSIGNSAFSGCKAMESMTVEVGNTIYDSRDNCSAIIETETNTLVSGCKNTIIPNSVTSIGDFAFDCCDLTSIEIPNSVTSIGGNAFAYSNLATIKCHAEEPPVVYGSIGSGFPSNIQVPNNSVEKYKATYPWKYCNITQMYPHLNEYFTVINYGGYSLKFIISDVGNTACEVICSSEPTTPTSITIPSSVEINGVECSVTSIRYDGFSGCSNLTNIAIPNSVTSIGSFAFAYSNLTNIEIPNSVTYIGNNAFYCCFGLTGIEIPNSVTSIGDEAFCVCSGLTNIEIPNSVTSIGNSAFSDCTGLTSIEIPNSVTSIGDHAFSWCSGLTNIEIPNSVTSIGNSAFSECYGLTSIEIPNSVTSIGDHAFSSCSGLTNIEIPNSVTSIGNEVFRYCLGLTSISVVSGNPIYDSRENCNAIIETSTNTLIFGCQNTIIPNSVTSIGNSAFNYCSGLTSIEIPSSVTSIGNSAFSGCTGLTSIEIPNSVTTIGDEAFKYCSLLSIKCFSEDVPETSTTAFASCPSEMNIQVPEGSVDSYKSAEPWKNYNVTKMYPYQNGDFIVIDYEGYSLKFTIINVETAECDVICYKEPATGTTIIIPSSVIISGTECSVTTMGDQAFSGCWGLTSIEIPNSVTSIGYNAFGNCSGLKSIEIPNSVTTIGDWAFSGCSGLTSISVESGSPIYDSRNNCNAIIETSTNTLIVGCQNTIIPNTITSIENSAFYNCSGLTSIEIPNSVTTIGNSAFYNCSGLTSIEIPNSVTSIGTSAFLGCSGLTSIKIPNSVTYIEDSAFKGCFGLTNIKIPNSVTFIGDNAFKGCSGLTSVEIPSSVTAIGNSAFDGCLYLATIKCHAEDVPETYSYFGDTFSNCPSDMTIYVPAQSLSLYQAAEPWNNYNIVALPDVGDNTIIDYDGYSLQFTVTNVEPAECEVICSTQPTTETAITIPSSVEINGVKFNVTSIGSSAFDCCLYLTSVEIPNSVTSIGNRAFSNCYNLTSLKIPDSVTSIGDWAFFSCFGLTTIEIPNSVTSIGDNAFYQCFGLTSIEIPNSVTTIGDWAFYGCSELTSLEIPNSVISIGDRAFNYCSGLTSIEIPNSVTSIGGYAFSYCVALETLKVEMGNTVYDSRDNCNAIIETETNTLVIGCKNTVIPNSVTSIGNSAFHDCSGLTSIEIPSCVTSIGNSAFSGCTGLTSIEIPSSVTSIGDCTFSGCTGLTSMEIPSSVTSIGDYAFYVCTRLTSIEIPNSVTYIGLRAFDHCSNLTTIKCHAESVPETNENAFSSCPSDMTIQVPAQSLSLYQVAEPWNNYNIVAGFNSNINVSSNITEGGFVEGGGNYQDGTEITVSAYVNPNYGFLYWSENDEIVSYSPNYSFIVSEDRKLVANFAINHWIPDYTIYPNFMAVTGVVQIDGIEQRDSNIEIGAFCGDELRGSNRLIYESEYDRYFLYLTIYGKDDDEISFRIYDNSEGKELKLYYNETMNFIVDDIVGNVSDPKIFNFTTDYIHRQQLTSNWNWYSTFVDVNGREGFEMMTENLGEQAIQIKNQSVFSNYNAGKWNGGLNTVSTGNMYMIKMSEPIELSMSGVIVEPSEFPIVINPNWKWIPYPVQEEMDIASAFAGFTPNDGDIVKSQDGFTQYYQGIGWNGSLNTMMPGEGYMYQNTSGEEKILYYPTQSKNRNALKANVTTEDNYWKPEVTKYPTNMNVIALVDNSSYDYEIGAFCNGECRGSARPIYIEELDKHIVFMTVYGDEEETIYLKYYDINNDEEYAVSDVFTFSVNAVLGNTMNPYVISLVPANVGETSTDELNIYPNPAKVNDEIYFTKEYEKVEIYNALGIKIAEYENSDYIDGIENAGIYVVKITDNGMSRYDRIIVK